MVNTSETKNEKLKNNEATVQVMKQPKTFAQQVEIIKEKGFIIDNDTECIGFLKQANYYRLSAYFLPFRKKDGTYFSNINTEFKESMNLTVDCVVYYLII